MPGATQAVVGEGPANAADRLRRRAAGRRGGPEGPALRRARPGRLLDRAFGEAGIERRDVYLTNAVKHFKFEQRGKRRIHAKPTAGEVSHYRWWLMRELELVEPKLVVALGGDRRAGADGQADPDHAGARPGDACSRISPGFITVHPSYLLRLPDEDAKAAAYATFVDDLRRVREIGGATRRGAVPA